MHYKIFFVAVLAVAGMSACKSATVGGNSTDASGSTVATKESTETDPKAILISSMKNLQDVKTWVADVDTSSDASAQSAVKMQVKYAAPDNFQIVTESGVNKMQMISIGKDAFIEANGKWQKAPPSVNIGQMINNWKEMYSEEKLAALKNIQPAGKETVNGKELSVYSYDIDQQAAMPEEAKKQMTDEMKAKLAEVQSENKAKIWIDREKNLPVKLEMTMKMTKPQQVTQNMSVNYIYDREVKIEAPKLP